MAVSAIFILTFTPPILKKVCEISDEFMKIKWHATRLFIRFLVNTLERDADRVDARRENRIDLFAREKHPVRRELDRARDTGVFRLLHHFRKLRMHERLAEAEEIAFLDLVREGFHIAQNLVKKLLRHVAFVEAVLRGVRAVHALRVTQRRNFDLHIVRRIERDDLMQRHAILLPPLAKFCHLTTFFHLVSSQKS